MTAVCGACGTDLAPTLLVCPACHSLIHSDRLKALADAADRAEADQQFPEAMARWREALELLPSSSRQYQAINAKLEALARKSPANPVSAEGKSWVGRSVGAAVAIVILAVTKGKFLLAGLLKLPTLFSMLAAFGVYWTIWGWKFALGVIATTYVHEMGHVAALVRYGIKASPPMFVPGLGAYVRLKQHLASAAQDARVGLAGPLWGLAAGLACFGVGKALASPSWLAIAHVTAFINLFNLLPLWQLDGGRAFHALSTRDRWAATLLIGVAWYASREGLLVLLGLVAAWQAWRKNAVPSDPGALAFYGLLVLALAGLSRIEVPTAGR